MIEILSPGRAAEALNTNLRTMERWRREGFGPAFVKIGRRVGYRWIDIEAWVESRVRRHTAGRGE